MEKIMEEFLSTPNFKKKLDKLPNHNLLEPTRERNNLFHLWKNTEKERSVIKMCKKKTMQF